MSVGTKTIVKDNNLEYAFKRFKNQVAKSGNLSKRKEKTEYMKPGDRRRAEKKNNIRNSRRNNKNR